MTPCQKRHVPANPAQLLTGEVRGFCRNKADREKLLSFGLTEKQTFMLGQGAENLAECIITYRGRAGWIVLPEDLRAFGDSKREIAAQSAELEKANIRILNLAAPDDTTYSAHVQRAQMKVSGARLQGKRTARRIGRLGGIGKGEAALAARKAADPNGLIERIVNDHEISWRIKARLLGDVCSLSTARRHYLAKNRS